MARTEATRYAFNRGLISPLALARVDLKRAALSAELQTNWVPRALGPMMLRTGLQYIGRTEADLPARFVEFVRSLSEQHMLEFTNGAMRVWTNDAFVTRAAVTTVVLNGDFDTALTDWGDNDEAGAASVWVAGGYMGLTGTGTAAAIRDQQITVPAASQNIEHALIVYVARGPVTLRVGTVVGDDSLINEVALGVGVHSLAFTPTGAIFFIRLMSRLKRQVLVTSINIAPAGELGLTSPYLTADLDYIRAGTDTQSADVMFVGGRGYQQRRVERRAAGRSWSVVLYQPEDGPFRSQNTGTATMTPSTLSGNGTLTCSVSFFRSTHVGALFRIESIGQTVSKSMTLLNDATASIRVTGITTTRTFTISLGGLTASGNTVVLQRSFDDASWTDVPGKSWTADTSETYTDGLDNQIVYYRLLCTVYAAGTTTAALSISSGSIAGVCRVVGYTSALVVDIEILTDFGSLTASSAWSEGLWSDYRGWPSSGALYEGRLNWNGYDSVVLSESDQFDAFNPDTEGDSAAINRTIGSGPMDTINWALPLQRLLLGAQLAEHSIRSNTFDEPLTPTNFNRKQASTRGSAAVQALRDGAKGFFVGRSGSRLYELAFDGQSYDYSSNDLTILNPEVCKPRIVRMHMQRMPDTRMHCVLSDGTAAVQVYDAAEQINCWVKIETDGLIEDVCVLPGAAGVAEDSVYYVVARTINGATVRHLEKWALEAECQGTYSTSPTLNKQADSFVVSPGGTTTITAAHLANEEVVVWGNGKDLGAYTLDAAGQATVSETLDANGAVVGLYYRARFKSAKLGQTLSKHKNVDHLAPVLYNTHAQGLRMGPDFTNMDPLPLMHEGAPVDATSTYATYDSEPQEFPGTWDVDARICLEAAAPRPCTILAMVIEGQVT